MLNRIFPNNIYASYFKEIESELNDCSSVLDVACGNNSPLINCKKTFKSTGVDIFEPYLIESRDKGIHDDYIISDALDLNNHVPDNSYDAVIALDLIEHLTKESGFNLLEILEKIAIKKVIVFTPNGFLRQKPFDDNPWQEHLSGWEIEEFEQLGYSVVGQGGWKHLRGERAKLKFRPHFFWSRISFLSQLAFKSYPKFSFQLLCIKSL